jgi:hypothetical protein
MPYASPATCWPSSAAGDDALLEPTGAVAAAAALGSDLATGAGATSVSLTRGAAPPGAGMPALLSAAALPA